MKKATEYTIDGSKVGEVALPAEIFDVTVNSQLIHQVYVAIAANMRSGSAHTKVRSDVRGGGRKPWKQKGTGNARTGSIRNPIWRGGGTIFGPLKIRNFTKSVNTKMRRKALFGALSQKNEAGQIAVVDSLALGEVKTKNVASFLSSAEMNRSVLFLLASSERDAYRAIRNIPEAKAIEIEKVNVLDVMNHQNIVLSKEGVDQLKNHFIK